MKKISLDKSILTSIFTISTFSLSSQADVIKCTFTEPYVSSSYSMTQSTLTYSSDLAGKQVIKNVSFQITSSNVFKLIAKDGSILQELTLSTEGSDGQSDLVYPYSVKDLSPKFSAHHMIGGCVSNYLKTKKN